MLKQVVKHVCIGMTVVMLSCTVESFAAEKSVGAEKLQDANELFRIYNEAEIEESAELEAEYKQLLESYNQAASTAQQKEIYNSMREEAVDWRNEIVKDIESEIDIKMLENQEIMKEISDGIMGDWEELKQLDILYKMNYSKVNQLLQEKSKYTMASKSVVDYEELDDLSKEISSAMTTYNDAKEVKILGEVSTVHFPLGKETVITSKFGDRVDPMTGTSIRFHAGIDLRASVGTPVLSLFNGVVSDTGFGVAGGYYVKVDHGNGIMTYYCHLSKITCEKGQNVNQYDQIALSGNTGSRTTGPHLHLGVYINGNPVDPEILFSR